MPETKLPSTNISDVLGFNPTKMFDDLAATPVPLTREPRPEPKPEPKTEKPEPEPEPTPDPEPEPKEDDPNADPEPTPDPEPDPKSKKDEPKTYEFAGKKYTQQEIEAILNRKTETQKPEPKAEKPEPEPEKPKKLTPEEYAQKRQEWVENFQRKVKFNVTEDEANAIVEGGKQASETMNRLLARAVAEATLASRESMYSELESRFEKVSNSIKDTETVAKSAQEWVAQQQQERAKQEFITAHPDLKDDIDIVVQMAEQLGRETPKEELAQMSSKEINEKVAEAARAHIARFRKMPEKIKIGDEELTLGEIEERLGKKPETDPQKKEEPKETPPPKREKTPVKPPAANAPAPTKSLYPGKRTGSEVVAATAGVDLSKF